MIKTMMINCVLLVACGNPLVKPAPYINPDFYVYLEDFKEDSQKFDVKYSISNLSVDYYNTNDKVHNLTETIAECSIHTENYYNIFEYFQMVSKNIFIDREMWEHLEDPVRKQLFYHELGHCLFGLEHTATGIMQPNIYTPITWDTDLIEFFNAATK